MRWVYDHYDAEVHRASLAAEVVADQFTWARTAAGFVDAIGLDRLEPPAATDGWYTPDVKLYRVVTSRDWRCEIAGTTDWLKRGKEYFELADVKWIAMEVGESLDPVCTAGDDTGLAPSQLAEVAAYSAKIGSLNVFVLNSQPTRADMYEEAVSWPADRRPREPGEVRLRRTRQLRPWRGKTRPGQLPGAGQGPRPERAGPCRRIRN